MTATTIQSTATRLRAPGVEFDEAQLAAVSFLARYSGRTLEAYRHDLRGFFQWATDRGIAVLEASRTTTIYDRRRQNFDRHAAYVVVAFIAGG
jgi:site-specific recombinase XerD